jgi:hypothetical protein
MTRTILAAAVCRPDNMRRPSGVRAAKREAVLVRLPRRVSTVASTAVIRRYDGRAVDAQTHRTVGQMFVGNNTAISIAASVAAVVPRGRRHRSDGARQ